MHLLTWIFLGLVAGLLAKWLSPGPEPGGLVMTILLGIGGAFVGGWLGTLIGFGDVNTFDLRSLALSVGGALLILFGYRQLRKS